MKLQLTTVFKLGIFIILIYVWKKATNVDNISSPFRKEPNFYS